LKNDGRFAGVDSSLSRPSRPLLMTCGTANVPSESRDLYKLIVWERSRITALPLVGQFPGKQM
jgi:hypothetical protein